MLKPFVLAAAAFLSTAGAALAGATCPPITVPTAQTRYVVQPCVPSPIAVNPQSECPNCPQSQVVQRAQTLECLQPVALPSFRLIPARDLHGRCVPSQGAVSASGHALPAAIRPRTVSAPKPVPLRPAGFRVMRPVAAPPHGAPTKPGGAAV